MATPAQRLADLLEHVGDALCASPDERRGGAISAAAICEEILTVVAVLGDRTLATTALASDVVATRVERILTNAGHGERVSTLERARALIGTHLPAAELETQAARIDELKRELARLRSGVLAALDPLPVVPRVPLHDDRATQQGSTAASECGQPALGRKEAGAHSGSLSNDASRQPDQLFVEQPPSTSPAEAPPAEDLYDRSRFMESQAVRDAILARVYARYAPRRPPSDEDVQSPSAAPSAYDYEIEQRAQACRPGDMFLLGPEIYRSAVLDDTVYEPPQARLVELRLDDFSYNLPDFLN